MYEYPLEGCRSTPMASYLKGLGVIRLLTEQKQGLLIKGYWKDQTFCILTELSKEELIDFFCQEYVPTPIVAPWNGGSGFYLGDPDDGIKAILSTDDKRFLAYQQVIRNVQSWSEMPRFETVGNLAEQLENALQSLGPGKEKTTVEGYLKEIHKTAPPRKVLTAEAVTYNLKDVENFATQKGEIKEPWKAWWDVVKKARTKCNEMRRADNKDSLLPLSRSRLPLTCLQWIDAVYCILGNGEASYNPLFGSGGNEGRLELSNSFMQRVSELLTHGEMETTRTLLISSIFSDVVIGLVKAKIGQYDPGRAGGYNQGMEVETKDFKINPWDFVLNIEGALVLGSAVSRRNQAGSQSKLSAPFTVRFSPIGFSSSTNKETGKAELWLPLWNNPASYREIKYLFNEGRSTLGRKTARTGLEFSRAVGTLGVDRGIEGFERYAFLERRGMSYVALPTGRIPVRYSPDLEILNELDWVTNPLNRFLREFKKNTPATFDIANSQIENAVFACSQKPDTIRFLDLVRAVGRMERLLALRDRNKDPKLNAPLFGLSPRWIFLCDDHQPEVRLAAGLASIYGKGKVGPLRTQMAGVDPLNPTQWSRNRNDCYWYGNSLSERLAGVLLRRSMDAERTGIPEFPIQAYLPLDPQDVMPFLFQEYDETKLEELLWGFTLVDWKRTGTVTLKKRWDTPIGEYPLSRTWAVIKLLHLTGTVRDVSIKKEPRIAQFLNAGRIPEATNLAVHRLKISELRPFEVQYDEQVDPITLLASLLIPTKNHWQLERLVLQDKTNNG